MGIKDYANLYIGCEVLISGELKRGRLNLGISYSAMWDSGWHLKPNGIYVFYPDKKEVVMSLNQVLLLLRPLSDMQNEESAELQEMGFTFTYPKYFIMDEDARWMDLSLFHVSKIIDWMRSHGFDVDGLIQAGLAIDKTKLK